jgi:hypothetical protein
MTGEPSRPLATGSPIARIAWILAGAICIFTLENIWVARKSHHRLPSFAPDALSGRWFLALLLLGSALLMLLICQILLMKDSRLSGRKNALTGCALLVAALLSGEWFVATGGTGIAAGLFPQQKSSRPIKVSWQASTTKNVRYNLYRGTSPGVHDKKLTPQPIDALTYSDSDVLSGVTYCYVARAVGPQGESVDSNEACVKAR